MAMTEKERTALRQAAYECYRLEWMLSHGRSLTELIEELEEQWQESGQDGSDGPAALFGQWEDEAGFKGSLWVCFDEFLGAEYRDPDYIAHLLGWRTRTDLGAKWEEDTGLKLPDGDAYAALVAKPASRDLQTYAGPETDPDPLSDSWQDSELQPYIGTFRGPDAAKKAAKYACIDEKNVELVPIAT